MIAADFSAVQFHFIRLVDLQFKIVLSLIGGLKCVSLVLRVVTFEYMLMRATKNTIWYHRSTAITHTHISAAKKKNFLWLFQWRRFKHAICYRWWPNNRANKQRTTRTTSPYTIQRTRTERVQIRARYEKLKSSILNLYTAVCTHSMNAGNKLTSKSTESNDFVLAEVWYCRSPCLCVCGGDVRTCVRSVLLWGTELCVCVAVAALLHWMLTNGRDLEALTLHTNMNHSTLPPSAKMCSRVELVMVLLLLPMPMSKQAAVFYVYVWTCALVTNELCVDVRLRVWIHSFVLSPMWNVRGGAHSRVCEYVCVHHRISSFVVCCCCCCFIFSLDFFCVCFRS